MLTEVSSWSSSIPPVKWRDSTSDHSRTASFPIHYLLALLLQSPAHTGSSPADFSTLKMETIHSSETSVHTRSTRRHVPEDGILNFFEIFL
jgi:hypothetical protein